MNRFFLLLAAGLFCFAGINGDHGCGDCNSCNSCHYESSCDSCDHDRCDSCGDNRCFCLNEIGIFTGYGRGDIHAPQDDYQVVPAFLRFGFNLNHYFGCGCGWGTFSFNIEPFANYVIDPQSGFEAGVAFMFQYSVRVFDCFRVYLEGGIGPMYLTIETIEQDQEGFNFLDQGGVGFQYFFNDEWALTTGYRFRHISHADFRHASNDGINSHTGIIGLSRFY
jgi:hypothetical protein